MKVAISIPDPVHRAVDRAARRLRIPRSQLYRRAVEEYLKRQSRPDVTARLDLVYGSRTHSPDGAVSEQGLETLRRVEWEGLMERGEVWWASLGKPRGSEPGHKRPVVVMQSDDFNRSGIATATVVALTTNMRLAQAPGNVVCRPPASGLPKPSVVNVSQIATIDRGQLVERAGRLPATLLQQVEDGLRLVLSL